MMTRRQLFTSLAAAVVAVPVALLAGRRDFFANEKAVDWWAVRFTYDPRGLDPQMYWYLESENYKYPENLFTVGEL